MSEVPLYRGTGPRSLNTDEFIPHERRIPFAAPRCAPAHRPSTPQSRATAQPTARARSRTTLTPAAAALDASDQPPRRGGSFRGGFLKRRKRFFGVLHRPKVAGTT